MGKTEIENTGTEKTGNEKTGNEKTDNTIINMNNTNINNTKTDSINHKTNKHSGFGPLLTLALLRKLDVAFCELLKFVCAKDGREFTKNSKTDILQELKGWIYEFDGNPIELAILIGDRNDLFNSEAGYVRKEELKQARKVIHELLAVGGDAEEEEGEVNSEQPQSKIQSETQMNDQVETQIYSQEGVLRELVEQSENSIEKEDGEQEGPKSSENRTMKEQKEEEKQKREHLLLEHLRFI